MKGQAGGEKFHCLKRGGEWYVQRKDSGKSKSQ